MVYFYNNFYLFNKVVGNIITVLFYSAGRKKSISMYNSGKTLIRAGKPFLIPQGTQPLLYGGAGLY